MRTATTASRWLVLTVLCAGYFLVLLDVTAINVALPTIGTDLGAGVSGLQWTVAGYTVALAAFLLPAGALGDATGHRQVVLVGLGIVGVASLACGLAPTTAALVAARVVQGIGAAVLLPGTLAIISRAFPGRAEQARAIGLWAALGSLALPAGPLLGGLLVQGPGWRWLFALNVPVVVIAALVVLRAVRPEPALFHVKHLDRAGAGLGTLFLAALTYSVVQAGQDGITLPVLLGAIVAIGSLAGFVAVERSAPEPLLPIGLFGRPAFTAANSVAAAMNFGTLGLLFLLTLFLQVVQRRSPLDAGLALLPLFLPLAVLAPLTGLVTARTGPRLPMVVGLLVSGAGVGLLSTWTAVSSYAHLLPAMLAWGVGLGLLTPAVVAAAVGSVPPARAGLASGVTNAARQTGGAIGIAAYGAAAGSPDAPDRFLAGLHTTGLLTAGLFGLAVVVTARFVPARRPAYDRSATISRGGGVGET